MEERIEQRKYTRVGGGLPASLATSLATLHLMLGTLYAAVFYGADRRGIQLKFGASQMPAIDAVFEANRAHVFSRTTHL